MAQSELKFLDVRELHGEGLLTASDYVFERDGRELFARVTSDAIRTLEGPLSRDEAILAVRTFLQDQIKNEWIQAGGTAELNGNAMEVVAIKLGWAHRFRKLMERKR